MLDALVYDSTWLVCSIFGGFILFSSLHGYALILLQATKTWKESTLSKIVQLTEEAQLKKPKLQRWLDEFGEHYSKVVVVLSIAVAVIGPFLFKWPFISTPGNSEQVIIIVLFLNNQLLLAMC